jgi:hypothetical protein
MNWIKGESKYPSDRSSQPFPSFFQPDSDDMLSEPSKYSCESAPRSVRTSSRTRNLWNGTRSETHVAISNTDGAVFPATPEPEPGSASLTQPPISFPTSPNPEPEEEPSYSPFVPLVFQHERLQQQLQKSVPLASFGGVPPEVYETVALKYGYYFTPTKPTLPVLLPSLYGLECKFVSLIDCEGEGSPPDT